MRNHAVFYQIPRSISLALGTETVPGSAETAVKSPEEQSPLQLSDKQKREKLKTESKDFRKILESTKKESLDADEKNTIKFFLKEGKKDQLAHYTPLIQALQKRAQQITNPNNWHYEDHKLTMSFSELNKVESASCRIEKQNDHLYANFYVAAHDNGKTVRIDLDTSGGVEQLLDMINIYAPLDGSKKIDPDIAGKKPVREYIGRAEKLKSDIVYFRDITPEKTAGLQQALVQLTRNKDTAADITSLLTQLGQANNARGFQVVPKAYDNQLADSIILLLPNMQVSINDKYVSFSTTQPEGTVKINIDGKERAVPGRKKELQHNQTSYGQDYLITDMKGLKQYLQDAQNNILVSSSNKPAAKP